MLDFPPPGALRGADLAIGALRVLTLLAALCLAVGGPAPSPATDGSGRAARLGVWSLFDLTLLSLLVHSRLFTRPVLLFAMVPATLDWLCYALVFTLAFALARDKRATTLLVAALLAGAACVTLVGAREYGAQALAGNRA